MKKIMIGMMSAIILFSSCDLLNNDPYADFTKQNYFTSEANVELYTNAFYNTFSGYGVGNTYGTFYFRLLNDNQVKNGIQTWNYTTITPTNSIWTDAYTEIRRTNTLIEKLPDIEMATANANHWMGVARLYRAYQHYLVVRTFGDCYWVDQVLTPNSEAIVYGKRHDRDVVMDNVLEDLIFAADNITLNAGSKTAFNVYVANAMKAEICLYEGTFAKYRTQAENGKAADETRAKKFLEEAKKACEVIMGGGFELTPGAEGYRANYNSLDLAGNKEMIMYKKYVNGVMGHSTQDYCCGSTITNGMSKAAFNSYLKLDGTIPAAGEDHGILEKVFDNDTVEVPSIRLILENRDPRLAQQVDPDLRYVGNGRARYKGMPGQEAPAENTSSSGYGVLKFDEPATPAIRRQSTTTNETDAPIFWLAEIYLDYAEACAELGTITKDDLDKSINLLRTRVGMPELTLSPAADPANNMEVSDLIWEIRRERRVELMYDKDDRYWCLIRWHQLDKLDTQKYPDQTKGAWINPEWKNPNDPSKPFYDETNVTLDAEGYIDCNTANIYRIYDKKHYLAPIPSGQSTLNPAIGQNLGWE